MSTELTIEFINPKDKIDFLSLFNKYKQHGSEEHPYILLSIPLDNYDPTRVYLNFNSFYANNAIGFEYDYGDCYRCMAYYLAYELIKKYGDKVVLHSDGKVENIEEYFSKYDSYHSSFFFTFEKYKMDKKEDKFLEKRMIEVKKIEDNLKTICPGFFDNKKFMDYVL